MSIETIYKRDVVSDHGTPLRVAAQSMRDQHIGALVVTAAEGMRVAGIVTDRDIVIEALAGEMTDLAAALRTGAVREAAAHGTPAAAPAGALLLPPEALAARWRQISEP